MAGIDNHIADSEISLLENLVTQNKKLKEVEKRSLSAYMHWRLNTPASTVGLKKRLETFRKSDKVAISHILIGVALADGRIAPTEIVQLEKLYGQLGLDKAMVTSDIHNLSSDRRLRAKQERATTVETSPQAQPAEIPSFSLDLDLLKLYEEETTDVQSVLESIFADDDVFDEPEMETRPEVQMSSGVIAKLDARYQNLYEKLITKEKCPLVEVEKFSREQRLMTEGAVETINDWAFDNVDAPLIDDGNVVYIDLEVAEEITTLQSQSQ